MIGAPGTGSWWWVTPDPNPRFALPQQIVTDPETGQIAVWSSGSPFLDGAYLAAEVLFGGTFGTFLAPTGDGIFIQDPPPRQIPD